MSTLACDSARDRELDWQTAAARTCFLTRLLRPYTRVGVYELVKRYGKRAALDVPSIATKQISPHIIQHSTAMHLLRAGVDINTIRGWLGHVALSTTNIYAEIDLEMKAKALGKREVTENPQPHKHWRDQPSNGVSPYFVVQTEKL